MREMSVTEQRYKAVLAVIADGRTVTEVAKDWGVSRQTSSDTGDFADAVPLDPGLVDVNELSSADHLSRPPAAK
jgi:hypothetical protein